MADQVKSFIETGTIREGEKNFWIDADDGVGCYQFDHVPEGLSDGDRIRFMADMRGMIRRDRWWPVLKAGDFSFKESTNG